MGQFSDEIFTHLSKFEKKSIKTATLHTKNITAISFGFRAQGGTSHKFDGMLTQFIQ